MAPGGVGADQHQQVRLVEILIAAGHRVGAEGAAVAGDGRCHAQPRIGVDIGRADKTLHQLVGDVIILGQHLAGQIERDRVGAIARDDVLQAMGDMIERVAPGDPLQHALAADHRMEQPVLQAPSVSPSADPLEHRRPKLAGCSPSPEIAAPPLPSGVASTPQPTPQ